MNTCVIHQLWNNIFGTCKKWTTNIIKYSGPLGKNT